MSDRSERFTQLMAARGYVNGQVSDVVGNTALDLVANRDRVEAYRAHPGFNQSTANKLLQHSPRHAWDYRNRRPGVDPNHSRDREIGTVTHAFVLGATSLVVEIDADDYRDKSAQASRSRAELAGHTPILSADVPKARRAATAVQEQLAGFGIELTGKSERDYYWTEKTPSGPLQCKMLLDHEVEDSNGITILDIKTGAEANPRRLVRRIVDAGNHVQAGAYVRGRTAQDSGRLGGRVRFIDVFVETSGLALITPVEIAGSLLELGEKQWRRACDTWARCSAEGVWPGYTDRVLRPEAPEWAMRDEFGDDAEIVAGAAE